MSLSNGHNPNSLLALEYSLRGNSHVNDSAQSVSAEALELPEGLENSQTEASAFDWDEAIRLAYQQPNPSEEPKDDQSASRTLNWDEAIGLAYEKERREAEAVDWKAGEDHSQEFGLVGRIPTGDTPAFTNEAGEQEPHDPLSQSNSLFALEQSVFGAPPAEPVAQQLSVNLPQSQVEAHAFDWDEAISLEYEGEEQSAVESFEAHAFDWDEAISLEYEGEEQSAAESFDWMPDEEPEHSTAESFDWLPTDESSYGMSLEDGPLTFTVEAFAVEDEDPPAQPPEPSEAKSFEAEAFEAEVLEAKTEPETAPAAAIGSDNPASALGTENDTALHPVTQPVTDESSKLGTTDEVSHSVGKSVEPSHAYDVDTDDDDVSISQSQAHSASEAIPVEATVVSPANSPQKSAAPIDFEQAVAIDFDALELDALGHSTTDTSQSADAAAFAADVAAILRGEKTYEPAETTPAAPTERSASPRPASREAAPQPEAQSLPPRQPSAHDIFDQMGRSMAHATAFDLGTFSLEQTFNEFDAILDEQESALSFSDEHEDNGAPDTHNDPATAQALEWDEDELAADLAVLSTGESWQASVQFALTDADINQLLGNNHPAVKETKQNYLTRLHEKAQQVQGYEPSDQQKIIEAGKAFYDKLLNLEKELGKQLTTSKGTRGQKLLSKAQEKANEIRRYITNKNIEETAKQFIQEIEKVRDDDKKLNADLQLKSTHLLNLESQISGVEAARDNALVASKHILMELDKFDQRNTKKQNKTESLYDQLDEYKALKEQQENEKLRPLFVCLLFAQDMKNSLEDQLRQAQSFQKQAQDLYSAKKSCIDRQHELIFVKFSLTNSMNIVKNNDISSIVSAGTKKFEDIFQAPQKNEDWLLMKELLDLLLGVSVKFKACTKVLKNYDDKYQQTHTELIQNAREILKRQVGGQDLGKDFQSINSIQTLSRHLNKLFSDFNTEILKLKAAVDLFIANNVKQKQRNNDLVKAGCISFYGVEIPMIPFSDTVPQNSLHDQGNALALDSDELSCITNIIQQYKTAPNGPSPIPQPANAAPVAWVWNQTFHNLEGFLPGNANGTYSKFDVKPPQNQNFGPRGSRRLVRDNKNNRWYYSRTHYGDIQNGDDPPFVLLDLTNTGY